MNLADEMHEYADKQSDASEEDAWKYTSTNPIHRWAGNVAELQRQLETCNEYLSNLRHNVGVLQKQADCPYTHVHMNLCTKCGWFPQEGAG